MTRMYMTKYIRLFIFSYLHTSNVLYTLQTVYLIGYCLKILTVHAWDNNGRNQMTFKNEENGF